MPDRSFTLAETAAAAAMSIWTLWGWLNDEHLDFPLDEFGSAPRGAKCRVTLAGAMRIALMAEIVRDGIDSRRWIWQEIARFDGAELVASAAPGALFVMIVRTPGDASQFIWLPRPAFEDRLRDPDRPAHFVVLDAGVILCRTQRRLERLLLAKKAA